MNRKVPGGSSDFAGAPVIVLVLERDGMASRFEILLKALVLLAEGADLIEARLEDDARQLKTFQIIARCGGVPPRAAARARGAAGAASDSRCRARSALRLLTLARRGNDQEVFRFGVASE